MRIRLDPLKTLPLLPAQNDLRSPALCHCGSAPFRKLFGCRQESLNHLHRKMESPKNTHPTSNPTTLI